MAKFCINLVQSSFELYRCTLLEGAEHLGELGAFALPIAVEHQFGDVATDAVDLHKLVSGHHQLAVQQRHGVERALRAYRAQGYDAALLVQGKEAGLDGFEVGIGILAEGLLRHEQHLAAAHLCVGKSRRPAEMLAKSLEGGCAVCRLLAIAAGGHGQQHECDM